MQYMIKHNAKSSANQISQTKVPMGQSLLIIKHNAISSKFHLLIGATAFVELVAYVDS